MSIDKGHLVAVQPNSLALLEIELSNSIDEDGGVHVMMSEFCE